MAFANKQAAFAYNNEYQKEKYERVTVLLKKEKGKKYERTRNRMPSRRR